MSNPIWKDKFVTLGTADAIEYRISVVNDSSSEVIYQGKSYKKPFATNNEIRINEVCADYLSHTLPTLDNAKRVKLSIPTLFKVETYISTAQGEEPDWEVLEFVQITNDWSYDYGFNASTQGLSFPVNGKVDARQWLIMTSNGTEDEQVVLTYKNGSTSVLTIVSEERLPLDVDETPQVTPYADIVLHLSQYTNLAKVAIGNHVFNVKDGCNRYVLHYVNAYGGRDSLLIEGNHVIEESLDRKTMKSEYSNRSASNRGLKNYVNELTKTITLHTGFLSDEQSARMHHLFDSTDVYLEDLEEGMMIPVVLDATSHQRKTFRNQGGSMVAYDIAVKVAVDMERR